MLDNAMAALVTELDRLVAGLQILRAAGETSVAADNGEISTPCKVVLSAGDAEKMLALGWRNPGDAGWWSFFTDHC